jgi:hypothetical protein
MIFVYSKCSKLNEKLKIVFTAETSWKGGCRLQILQEQIAGKVQVQKDLMADLNTTSQLKHLPASRQTSLSALK